MFGGDEDEEDVLAPKEPQVTSADPEERKAARALRIKKRQEALKKAELPPEEIPPDEELGIVEQATSHAAEELQRLALDGAATVTNVKVICDEREVERRNLNLERVAKLTAQIEDEAVETQLAYEAVTENWEAMMKIRDPLDIDAAMKQQKIACDELLNQKEKLVQQIREDLKNIDIQYHEDLQKQDADIKELSDRIEKQLTIMAKAYEKQLNLIEEALNIEREAIVDHNNKRWEALYKQRDKEEQIHIEIKRAQLEEHKEEIEKIMWDHFEKYRVAKIELETLIQELQKELEKLKTTCLINTEKIGYNYQVLKKREEENIFVRSEQKRKLNKMQDVANALRQKIRKAVEDAALEEIRAEAEIAQLIDTMSQLEKKCHQFAQVNDSKFHQVWQMAQNNCSELLQEIREAEVALHSHVLAEPPPPPPPKPPKSPLAKKESESNFEKSVVAEAAKNPDYAQAKNNLVQHILTLIADNTGFLIEDRLLTLIEKYQPKSKNLCTLDSIFMALEVQKEEDIELLAEVFLSYAFCPVCVLLEDGDALTDAADDDDAGAGADAQTAAASRNRATSSVRGRTSTAMGRSMSTSTSRSGHVVFRTSQLCVEDQLLVQEADEIITRCGDPQASTMVTGAASEAGGGSMSRRATARGVTVTTQSQQSVRTSNPFVCEKGHPLEIEPMQLLAALGEFVSKFIPPDKRKLYDILDSVKPPVFDTVSRSLTNKEIEDYWEQWRVVFPAEKERLWDGMIVGLNDYLNTLQERAKIHDEVVVLRRKNAALRRLVSGSLPEIMPQQKLPATKYLGPYPNRFMSSNFEPSVTAALKLPQI